VGVAGDGTIARRSAARRTPSCRCRTSSPPLQASLNTLSQQISDKEAALTTSKADLSKIDAQIVTQSATLRTLESAKKPNRDAVAAQKAVVAGLQTQYAAVLDRIAAIDGTIALGGCLA
jgi:septal ring factor EnvC (AmiA/AmiB activator)